MFVSSFTAAGKRPQNEDALYPAPGETSRSVFIIADGLGGHASGQMASSLAVRTLREILEGEDPASYVLGGHRLPEDELLPAFLSDAMRQTGASVYHTARQMASDMGTTALAVLLHGQVAYCAHIGDSALLSSDANGRGLSLRTVPHRRGAGLTRSLGAQEQISPDVFALPWDEGQVIVMGTDGFWEWLNPAQIEGILAETPPFAAAQRLVQAALEAGSPDNVTVMVIEGQTFASRGASQQVRAYAAWLEAHPEQAAGQFEALQAYARQMEAPSQTASGSTQLAELEAQLAESKKWAFAYRKRALGYMQDLLRLWAAAPELCEAALTSDYFIRLQEAARQEGLSRPPDPPASARST